MMDNQIFRRGQDYILVSRDHIEHRIGRIVGWHEYNFDLLAFLVRELYK